MSGIYLQPSSKVFEKDIQEYIQGLEPIPCHEDVEVDDSSGVETSEDSSSESDSEVHVAFL